MASNTARPCADPTLNVSRPFWPVYRPACHVFVLGFFNFRLNELCSPRNGLFRFLRGGIGGGSSLHLGSKSPLSSWSTQVLGLNPKYSRVLSRRKLYFGNDGLGKRSGSLGSWSSPQAVIMGGYFPNSSNEVDIMQKCEKIIKKTEQAEAEVNARNPWDA